MGVTDALVLAPDVLIVRVDELPEAVRDEIGGAGGFALTRPRARASSSLVDEAVVDMLAEFRSASTIVDAVIRYSSRLGLDPEQTLEDAYPALRMCVGHGYLVVAGSAPAGPAEVCLAPGQRVAGGTVVRCVQVLEDTELYQLAMQDGGLAALKVLRPSRSPLAVAAMEREVEVLRYLGGRVAPGLLDVGAIEQNPWLAMEWCDGVPVSTAAAVLRRSDATAGELADLCRRVAEAYAQLHRDGVVHGDVHPGNVLVSATGAVRLVDFGLARVTGGHQAGGEPPRGGVQAFFDPQYAAALLDSQPADPATPASEQFSIAALLYQLLTGGAYLDFSLDSARMLRQIVDDEPLPFVRRGRRPWLEMETLLAAALAKDPSQRLPNVDDLARQLGAVLPPVAAPADRAPRHGAALEPVLASVLAKVCPAGEWFDNGPTTAPFCSLAHGAAGIAAALYRVGVLRASPDAIVLADEWVVKAAQRSHLPGAFTVDEQYASDGVTGRVTPFHTVSGVHAVQALVGHAMDNVSVRQRALDAFVAESQHPCDNVDLTLGRSGTLLGATLLVEAIGTHADLTGLVGLGSATVAGIWSALDALPPIAEGTSVTYLGVAHGWAGMLLATLRWCHATGAAIPTTLPARLDQLATLAEPAGIGLAWPVSNQPDSGGAAAGAPGWCHGSAGYVHLWTTAHTVLGEDRWAVLAERAAWHAYAAPDRIAQLCCGLAGRAYSLLAIYRHTGEPRWLTTAARLATEAAAALDTDPPGPAGPASLHKGEVGVAVLAADLDCPEVSAMPFFGRES